MSGFCGCDGETSCFSGLEDPRKFFLLVLLAFCVVLLQDLSHAIYVSYGPKCRSSIIVTEKDTGFVA